ncbi:hypothetical protein BN1356_00726 [Streptococcus varani]|uniref:Uncharacterized protein n=1 Tax=Streptococcus varani TaxID=1608583 RepID=A0A0E4CSC1_9STRE|nr:hypothetical protein BN1356_00726 [Streptococcus varani]
MKRFLVLLVTTIFAFILAATVFAQSFFIGPLLIILSVCSFVFSMISLYQKNKKIAEIVLELMFNFLMWP